MQKLFGVVGFFLGVMAGVSSAQINGSGPGTISGTITFSAGGGSGSSQTIQQTQSFTLGEAVYNNNGTWTASDNVSAPYVSGVVTTTGATSFGITYSGAESTITGLTANTTYYLGSAGALTSTEPSSTSAYLVFVLQTGTTSNGVVNISPPISLAEIPTSVISGTITNDNAAAGNIGEFMTATLASGSATSLSTTTAKTFTSGVALTAGDWDVWCVFDFVPASSTITLLEGGPSSSANTLSTTQDQNFELITALTTVSGTITYQSPVTRISLASTTTYYPCAYEAFSAGTNTVYGSIQARRRR